jgi:stalled ribosome rescue protein Dom34
MKKKRRYRRGYPVAVLVGFELDHAVLWRVFSQVVKPSDTLKLNGKRIDEKSVYNFHESVLDLIKPILNEGTRTVVIASPARTSYSADFLEHIQRHHRYLIQSKSQNRANFAQIEGSAEDRIKVAKLVKTKEFTEIIAEKTADEADHILDRLEKHLYDTNSTVLYALKEIEDIVYKQDKSRDSGIEYLLLTNKYLAESRQKSRIYRLMQIAKNKKIMTKVIDNDTAAGNRINQFGGMVFFSTPDGFDK